MGAVTCDVSLLFRDSPERFRTFFFVKILLCRGDISGVLWVCCVSRFLVYVIAHAARMRAQEGGSARIVLCAVVSCNAVRVLFGIAAVGVRVMMCVRLCSLPPFLYRLCRVDVDARSRVVV